MITGVAFVPQAPALVPEVGRGLDAELGNARKACRDAIRRVATPDVRVVIVADGDGLAGYGPQLDVGTVGEWLVRDAVGPRQVTRHPASEELPDLLDGEDVALIVVGDGSARHSEKAPGYLDPQAAERDEQVRRGLSRGDAALLHPGGFDDHRLLVAGSRAWDTVAWQTETAPWDAELLYDDAPFGVGYFVAVWTARA